ncbi:MAG: hypothetical protein ACREUT_08095 [Steroidobacteraceae bacterium]
MQQLTSCSAFNAHRWSRTNADSQALTKAEILKGARHLAAGAPVAGPDRVTRGDSYYFESADPLPVYGVVLKGGDQTRYYLDLLRANSSRSLIATRGPIAGYSMPRIGSTSQRP